MIKRSSIMFETNALGPFVVAGLLVLAGQPATAAPPSALAATPIPQTTSHWPTETQGMVRHSGANYSTYYLFAVSARYLQPPFPTSSEDGPAMAAGAD
jgi:hypothetical protein